MAELNVNNPPACSGPTSTFNCLWVHDCVAQEQTFKGNSAQSASHRAGQSILLNQEEQKLLQPPGGESRPALQVLSLDVQLTEKLADLALRSLSSPLRHLSTHFNFSFMLFCPMIYSWLLSGLAILTGRPGGESIEAGKKKSSAFALQMYFWLVSWEHLQKVKRNPINTFLCAFWSLA